MDHSQNATGHHGDASHAQNDLQQERVLEPRDGTCQLRGFGMLNSLSFAHQKGGEQGIKGALKRLSEADQETLIHLKRLRWYPFALHCRLLRAVDAEVGTGDLSVLHDLGYHSASRDASALFRPFLRLGHPGWVIDVSTKLWRFFHREGKWELERTPLELVAKLHDFEEADMAFCISFIGYVTGLMELSGAQDVEGTHVACRSTGAPHCVFTVRWSAK